MAPIRYTPPDARRLGERAAGPSPVTVYLSLCRTLEPEPSEAVLRQLRAAERAARKAVGEAIKRT